jgi:hypothetical protein
MAGWGIRGARNPEAPRSLRSSRTLAGPKAVLPQKEPRSQSPVVSVAGSIPPRRHCKIRPAFPHHRGSRRETRRPAGRKGPERSNQLQQNLG